MTEEPGGPQFLGSQRVRHDGAAEHQSKTPRRRDYVKTQRHRGEAAVEDGSCASQAKDQLGRQEAGGARQGTPLDTPEGT